LARVLVVRPSFDDATKYTSEWLGVAIQEAKAMGHSVVDLYGPDATPTKIIDAFNTHDPEMFISDGHGSATVLSSQNRAVLFVACQNDEGLAGRSVYALSCLTAQTLGPSAYGKGATLYVGYLPEFVWVINPGAPSPLQDSVARPFMDFALAPARELLAGRPWNMVNGAVRVGNDWLSRLNRETSPDSAMQSLYLRQDVEGLVGYGVPSRRLGVPSAMFLAPLFVGVGLTFYGGRLGRR